MRLLLLALLALTGTQAHAHGGGLDSYGCHHNRKFGGYHCHRGALAGQAFASKAAMLEELLKRQEEKAKAKESQRDEQ